MSAGRKSKVWLTILILILVPILFGAGYAVTANGIGEKALHEIRQWFGIGEMTVPPDGDDDPGTPGNSGEDPAAEPRAPDQPQPGEEEPTGPQPGPEDPGKEPVIYVGQALTIPVSGRGGSSISKVVTSGTTSSGGKQIALTFDSGWLYEQTIPLLNVLDQYGVKATFFPRALWLKDNPDLGREIARRGHTVGNHSLTHSHMIEMSAADIRTELRQSTQIIQDICGVRSYLFRPPYGEYNNRLLEILAEEGYPYSIMWTIDTLDWDAGNTRNVGGKQTYIDVDFIVQRTLNNASNNGIVLMHVGGPDTVKALPRIIEGLRNQGYSFTTVDRMLPPPGSSGQATHTVQSGDTLYSIARRYGVSVQQIIDANNL